MSCARCIVRILKNVSSPPPTAARMRLLSNVQIQTPDKGEIPVKVSNKLPKPYKQGSSPKPFAKGVSLSEMTTNVRHVVKNLRATP